MISTEVRFLDLRIEFVKDKKLHNGKGWGLAANSVCYLFILNNFGTLTPIPTNIISTTFCKKKTTEDPKFGRHETSGTKLGRSFCLINVLRLLCAPGIRAPFLESRR